MLQQPVRDPALTDTYVERKIAVVGTATTGKLMRGLLVLGYLLGSLLCYCIKKLKLGQRFLISGFFVKAHFKDIFRNAPLKAKTFHLPRYESGL